MLRKLFSLGALQGLGLLIGIVRGKVFALLLGPARFGVVAVIDQLVTSVAQFANLSLPFTAMKFLSRDHSLGEQAYRKTYSAFLKAMALVALVATLVAVTVLLPRLGEIDPQLARYEEPVFVALLGLPAAMLLVFFVNVLASRQRAAQSLLLNLLFGLVLLVAGGLGCWLGGIEGIYVAAVPASTALIFGVMLFVRVKLNLPFHQRSEGWWRGLRANAPVIETAFFTYVAVASYSGMLLIARYQSLTWLSEADAGFLQACLAVALSIGAVLTAAANVAFAPYVNRAITVEEKFAAADHFLPRLLLLFCLGALAVLLFPELILRGLFSDQFTVAAAILPWFVIWQCLAQVANVQQQLLVGLDDVKGCCVLIVLGTLLSIALCFLLTGPFGLAGIGAAFLGGTLVTTASFTWRLRSRHKAAVSGQVLILTAFSVLGCAALAASSRLTEEWTLMGLAARGLTAVVFLAGLWCVLPRGLRSELRRRRREAEKPRNP